MTPLIDPPILTAEEFEAECKREFGEAWPRPGWDVKRMLSQEALRIIEENRSTSIGTKNAPTYRAADEMAQRLQQRQGALMKNPVATPIERVAAA